MTYFNARTELALLQKTLAAKPDATLVACFCAQWCKTCQQYQTDFQALAQQWPEHLFIWIDIEELPELLGETDIDDFPTLQIVGHEATLFYGPTLPHSEHLDRLLRHLPTTTSEAHDGPADLRQLIAAAA